MVFYEGYMAKKITRIAILRRRAIVENYHKIPNKKAFTNLLYPIFDICEELRELLSDPHRSIEEMEEEIRQQEEIKIHIEKFLNSYVVTESGCWEYTRRTTGTYGSVILNGELYPASRASYLLHFGIPDKKLYVCHKCDNPPCINPDHLFLGTAKDNSQDRERKHRGNHPKGNYITRKLTQI